MVGSFVLRDPERGYNKRSFLPESRRPGFRRICFCGRGSANPGCGNNSDAHSCSNVVWGCITHIKYKHWELAPNDVRVREYNRQAL
jgi:hypothetical protein